MYLSFTLVHSLAGGFTRVGIILRQVRNNKNRSISREVVDSRNYCLYRADVFPCNRQFWSSKYCISHMYPVYITHEKDNSGIIRNSVIVQGVVIFYNLLKTRDRVFLSIVDRAEAGSEDSRNNAKSFRTHAARLTIRCRNLILILSQRQPLYSVIYLKNLSSIPTCRDLFIVYRGVRYFEAKAIL